jgi:hypothetical protein
MADLDGYDPCWSDPDPEYWSSEMTLTVKKNPRRVWNRSSLSMNIQEPEVLHLKINPGKHNLFSAFKKIFQEKFLTGVFF